MPDGILPALGKLKFKPPTLSLRAGELGRHKANLAPSHAPFHQPSKGRSEQCMLQGVHLHQGWANEFW